MGNVIALYFRDLSSLPSLFLNEEVELGLYLEQRIEAGVFSTLCQLRVKYDRVVFFAYAKYPKRVRKYMRRWLLQAGFLTPALERDLMIFSSREKLALWCKKTSLSVFVGDDRHIIADVAVASQVTKCFFCGSRAIATYKQLLDDVWDRTEGIPPMGQLKHTVTWWELPRRLFEGYDP